MLPLQEQSVNDYRLPRYMGNCEKMTLSVASLSSISSDAALQLRLPYWLNVQESVHRRS